MSSSTVRRLTLTVLCAAQFMLIVDVVVLNVALPSIKSALQIEDAQLPLTGIAYTLTFGSLLIVAGRAGDLLGRRRIFLVGLAVFTVASAATGLAQETWQLFAGRALQGVGAAMISPTTLALLTSVFPEGSARNRALGLWAAMGSGGAIAGQLLGGLITDALGWRWIFFLNAPVGVAALILAYRLIPESRSADRPPLDIAGATTLAATVGALTLGLSRVSEHGFDSWTALAAVIAGGFALSFMRIERRQRTPLVRFDLLRPRGVWTGNTVLALLAGATAGALFFTTLYLQLVLGYSALEVGTAFAPVTLVVLLVSPVAGRLVDRVGLRRLLVAGTSTVGAGLLYLSRIDTGGTYLADVLPGLALVALGSGLAFAPTMIAATNGVRESERGLASGVLATSQELGTAIGLAALASVATVVTRGSEQLTDRDASTTGYRAGFLAALAMIGVAVLIALRAPRRADDEAGTTDAADRETSTTGVRSEDAAVDV